MSGDGERNLVAAEWLAERLGDPSVVVVDCRFDLDRPELGRNGYLEAHIPGARYLHLEEDLTGPKTTHGGRHPLPDPQQLCEKLGGCGVDEDVTVVAYDDNNGLGAARLWWLLRYLGHPRPRVLDGGWPAWVAGGWPVASGPEAPAGRRRFAGACCPERLAGVEEVRAHIGRGSARLVDSRAPDRYRGENETRDPVGGHIPGAINLHWKDNLTPDGRFKPPEALRARFSFLLEGAREIIVYCGSGVTACVNVLAMEEAGIRHARLYPGSWSDWCSYPEHPIARGEVP